MCFGDRGAKRRHGMADAGLGQRDDIHIAFGHDQRAGFAGCGAGGTDVVERATLVEERCLGRVQIFRFLIGPECARPEGDRAPARVTDRKHNSAAKAVVCTAAVARQTDKACLHKDIARKSTVGQMAEQVGSRVRGETDLELFDRFGTQAAALQIGACLGGAGTVELRAIEADRGLHGLDQTGCGSAARGVCGIARGHRHAGFGRQPLHRLHETEIFGLPHETHDIATGVAAEAMITTLQLLDVKRGRLLLMEGTRRPIVATGSIRLARIPSDLPSGNGGNRDTRA